MKKQISFEEIVSDVEKAARLLNDGFKRKPEKVSLDRPLSKFTRDDWHQMNLQSMSNWKKRSGL